MGRAGRPHAPAGAATSAPGPGGRVPGRGRLADRPAHLHPWVAHGRPGLAAGAGAHRPPRRRRGASPAADARRVRRDRRPGRAAGHRHRHRQAHPAPQPGAHHRWSFPALPGCRPGGRGERLRLPRPHLARSQASQGPRRHHPAHQHDRKEQPMSWSELPTNLRTVLGAALLLVIGVAIASFTLSFIALREVASAPVTGWGRNAWIFPLCVVAALLASEVVLVGVSMIKGVNRAVPFTFMVLFGALTVWFNVARVPADWRLVTAVPPVAGIFMTLLLSFLLKVLALATGKTMVYEAPPPQAGYLMAPQTTVVQLPDGSYGVPGSPFPGYRAGTFPPQGAFGQMPSSEGVRNPQIGHAEIDDATKRRAVEMYLSHLTADQLGVATASSVVVALAGQGMPIGESYAGRILSDYKAAQKSANGARTSVRRKA